MERRKADPSLGATPQLNLKQTLFAIKRFPPTFRNWKVIFIKYDFQQLHTMIPTGISILNQAI
jgi:hypothetical protein